MIWRRLRAAGVLGLNERNARLIAPLNPRERFPAVDDKLESKRLATAAGIPVPRLLGEIGAYGDVARVHEIVENSPEFVIKPVQGAQGNGVLVIDGRDGDDYLRSDGSRLSKRDLEYHLAGILAGLHSLGGRTDRAMVEERLHVHPALAAISHGGVPDIRVIVHQGVPAMAMLRLPTVRSRGRANLHQGAVAAGIDLATGRTTHGLLDGRPCLRHPDTGQLVVDRFVPDWARILELSSRAAAAFGLGYLGIDVVLDARHGPVLLEGNARPGLAIQLANDAGLLPRLDPKHHPPPTPPPRPAWHRAFQDVTRTHGFEPVQVEGKWPESLKGALFRVGPGRFANFGHEYGHWFDGDGLVTAFRSDGAKVEAACRFVETPELARERAAGRALYGNYGTNPPGGWWRRFFANRPKNSANTATWLWQDRLFALQEASPPTELDPLTLDTLGERALVGDRPFVQSAHPRRVASRRCTWNFSVEYGRTTSLVVHALPDEGNARFFGRFPLAGATMIHDFAATERSLVVLAPPLRLDLARMLARVGTYSDNLRWRPELGTEVLVIPIDDPANTRRFTIDPGYHWHVANAFDDGTGIVVDLVNYPDFSSNRWLQALPAGRPVGRPDGRLTRLRLDPGAGTARAERLSDVVCEFPRIDPAHDGARHTRTYIATHADEGLAAGAPHDAVAAFDHDTGALDRFDLGRWGSEPVFVASPGSAGHVLVQVYDDRAHRSGLQVFDADHLAQGPLATAWLDHAVPLTFHGTWRRSG